MGRLQDEQRTKGLRASVEVVEGFADQQGPAATKWAWSSSLKSRLSGNAPCACMDEPLLMSSLSCSHIPWGRRQSEKTCRTCKDSPFCQPLHTTILLCWVRHAGGTRPKQGQPMCTSPGMWDLACQRIVRVLYTRTVPVLSARGNSEVVAGLADFCR